MSEIAPCVVTEKETGEITLYGDEAAALEGRVPAHLEFHRLWWADKILDRERFRLLLQLLLDNETKGSSDRWRRPWQTQILVPESMLPLHRRWLEKTAREAGWWLPSFRPANQNLVRSSSHATAANWRVQSFLDVGFSQTRLVVYVGREVLLAVATKDFSLSVFCRELAESLQAKHSLEVAPSSFYDQNWTRTRLAFNQKKQKPQEWSLEASEWKQQQQFFWQELSEWIREQITVLAVTHRTEIEQREITVVGGGASLWDGMKTDSQSFLFRRAGDAPYAQLRASLSSENAR